MVYCESDEGARQMIEPTATTFAVPVGQPMALALFYVSEVSVQASVNDATIVLMDSLPVAGEEGVNPSVQQRRPLAMIKVSPHTLKGMANALLEAVRMYEENYGTLQLLRAARENE